MDWFLYYRGNRHERANANKIYANIINSNAWKNEFGWLFFGTKWKIWYSESIIYYIQSIKCYAHENWSA